MGKEFLVKKTKEVKAVFLEKKSTNLQPNLTLNTIKNNTQQLSGCLATHLLIQEPRLVRH